ncbi:putative RNA-binding protein 46, partial [Aphis craccivora]
ILNRNGCVIPGQYQQQISKNQGNNPPSSTNRQEQHMPQYQETQHSQSALKVKNVLQSQQQNRILSLYAMLDNSEVTNLLKASSLQTINTTTITNTPMMITTNKPTTSTTTSTTHGLPNRDGMRRLFMGNLPKAVEAKHRLSRCMVFWCKTIVDWVDPELEPDVQQIAKYGDMLNERTLADVFGRYGKIERVKNLKNYAFVHFERRSDAKNAMDALDGTVGEATGVRIDVSWAKSLSEKHVRERMLRDRERLIRLTIRTNDTTVSAFASNTEIGSTVRYSNYDHFEHDFGRQTFESITYRVRRNVEAVTVQRKPRNYEEFVAHNIETLTIQ